MFTVRSCLLLDFFPIIKSIALRWSLRDMYVHIWFSIEMILTTEQCKTFIVYFTMNAFTVSIITRSGWVSECSKNKMNIKFWASQSGVSEKETTKPKKIYNWRIYCCEWKHSLFVAIPKFSIVRRIWMVCRHVCVRESVCNMRVASIWNKLCLLWLALVHIFYLSFPPSRTYTLPFDYIN